MREKRWLGSITRNWRNSREVRNRRQMDSGNALPRCSPSLERTDTDLVRSPPHTTFDIFRPLESIPCGIAHSPSLIACLPLDRSSPKFANRLNDALHGQEYVQCVQNFREDDLVWFVDYLDKARHHVTPSHLRLKRVSRLSTVSILWDPLPESVCANSETYVQLTLHFQHPI